MVYIYLVLIFLALILIYMGVEDCNKFAPLKIKFLCNIVYLGLLIRFIILFMFTIWNNIIYVYYVSPAYFLNYLVIPIAALISYYVLIRSNKAKFVLIISLSAFICIQYIISNIIFDAKLYTNSSFGYWFSLMHINILNAVYVVTFFLVLIATLMNYKKIKDSYGKKMLLFSSIFSIVEGFIFIMKINFFPVLVINDICWMLTLNYCIKKLKR